jgi:hypothetical protein
MKTSATWSSEVVSDDTAALDQHGRDTLLSLGSETWLADGRTRFPNLCAYLPPGVTVTVIGSYFIPFTSTPFAFSSR